MEQESYIDSVLQGLLQYVRTYRILSFPCSIYVHSDKLGYIIFLHCKYYVAAYYIIVIVNISFPVLSIPRAKGTGGNRCVQYINR